MLNPEISQPFSNQSVFRIPNIIVCAARLLQRLVIDAQDAGVMKLSTTAV